MPTEPKILWSMRFKKARDNPKALISVLKRKLYRNPTSESKIKYFKELTFLNYKDTIDYAIKNNMSIMRFGDTLPDIMDGISVYFADWKQTYRKTLAKRLDEVLSINDDRILKCFNLELITMSKSDFDKLGRLEEFNTWASSRHLLQKYLKKGQIYGSALCFQPSYNKELDFRQLADYFSSKHIIIATSQPERFNNLKLGITTSFIEAPRSDSWDKYDEIKNDIIKTANNLGVDKSNILVMISATLTADVLVYDLTKIGYQVWDTGQFFDLASREISKL